MKTREMAEQLVDKLARAGEDGISDNDARSRAADAVEAFADQVIAEAWSRASVTIEQATIGVRYDDGI